MEKGDKGPSFNPLKGQRTPRNSDIYETYLSKKITRLITLTENPGLSRVTHTRRRNGDGSRGTSTTRRGEETDHPSLVGRPRTGMGKVEETPVDPSHPTLSVLPGMSVCGHNTDEEH